MGINELCHVSQQTEAWNRLVQEVGFEAAWRGPKGLESPSQRAQAQAQEVGELAVAAGLLSPADNDYEYPEPALTDSDLNADQSNI